MFLAFKKSKHCSSYLVPANPIQVMLSLVVALDDTHKGLDCRVQALHIGCHGDEAQQRLRAADVLQHLSYWHRTERPHSCRTLKSEILLVIAVSNK